MAVDRFDDFYNRTATLNLKCASKTSDPKLQFIDEFAYYLNYYFCIYLKKKKIVCKF